MKFLTRPEFLTSVAAWLCALGVHLGLDVPAELIYGAASLVSIAAGGVAIQRNKKNGGGGSAAAVITACLLLPAIGCGATGSAVQGYLKNYPHAVKGDFDGVAANDFNYVLVEGRGAGEFVVFDRQKKAPVFSFPVSGEIKKAWKVVLGDGRPSFQEVPYEEAQRHFSEAGVVPAPVPVVP